MPIWKTFLSRKVVRPCVVPSWDEPGNQNHIVSDRYTEESFYFLEEPEGFGSPFPVNVRNHGTIVGLYKNNFVLKKRNIQLQSPSNGKQLLQVDVPFFLSIRPEIFVHPVVYHYSPTHI
uniref:Uncharacterized protein n=1 Tax=Cacopsylla melanoneura TaxID=428564 RepID=A0A8D8QGX9_9HEMI